MTESWDNLKIVLATEVPGEPWAGIFVYYDTVLNWSDGIGVVSKGVIEVRTIWYSRVDSGLLEDIEDEIGLFEEEVPEVFW